MDYTLPQIASQVRRDIVRMVTAAASGHPGGSLSSTDFLTYLFFKEMNVTPETWRRNGYGLDQFFLSAGHISPVLYSLLARRGYFPVAELAVQNGRDVAGREEELVESFTAAAPRFGRDVHLFEKQLRQEVRRAERSARVARSRRRDHAHDVPPDLRCNLGE